MNTLPDKNLANVNEMLALMPDRVKAALSVAIERIDKIKWKTVEFVIPEVPEPSHRPRLCGFRVYVPGAAKHQKYFQMRVLPKLNGLFITTPCIVKADIYCKMPSSFTKTQKVLAEMKLLRPSGNTGDVDNYSKTILDQMQPNEKRNIRGIMANDCLVLSMESNKYYSIDPRYEVSITYMDDVPEELKTLLKIKDE